MSDTEPESEALEFNRIVIRKILDDDGRVGILVDYGENIALSDAIQMLAWANQFVVRDFFAEEGDDK